MHAFQLMEPTVAINIMAVVEEDSTLDWIHIMYGRAPVFSGNWDAAKQIGIRISTIFLSPTPTELQLIPHVVLKRFQPLWSSF